MAPPAMMGARSLVASVVVLVAVGVGLIALTSDEGSDAEATPTVAVTSTATRTPTATEVATPRVVGTAEGVATATPGPLATVPLPLEQHGELREYEPLLLEAAGFVNTGTLIAVPFNRVPAARSSFRAGFSVVETLEAGYFNLREEGWHRGVPPGGGVSSTQVIGLTATVEGRPLYLTVRPASVDGEVTTRLLGAGRGELAFYATDDARPLLTLEVGTFRPGPPAELAPVPAIVDRFGRLWVRPAPVSGEPIATDTGELLGVAGATVLGPLDWPRFLTNETRCGDQPACTAVIHQQVRGGLHALAAGTAECDPGEGVTVELTTDRYQLRFTPVPLPFPPSDLAADCVGAFPREVAAGDLLSERGSWEVSGTGTDGAALHVAVGRTTAESGPMLYVGVERTIEQCSPCFTGASGGP